MTSRPVAIVCLIALVVAGYFTMATALPVRGEESRWARVAVEMIETGDWVVPRQQGEPFLDRPPLGPWAIALVGMARGQVDVVAIRLPSAVAILATTLLVYGYCRRCLPAFAAFSAGATFASFALVQQIGWTGESEAVYTLLLSGALLLWHHGHTRGWPPAVTWSVGYGLAALAMLAKGLQAPVYFVSIVTAYLLIHRQWRDLLSVPHAIGISMGALCVGLWLWPFHARAGSEATVALLTGVVAGKFGARDLLAHVAAFPFVMWASLLPGSVVVTGLLYPRVFTSLRPIPSAIRFALVALVVTWPSVWLAAHARPRHFMALLPLAAVLVGWAVDRLVTASPASAAQRWWQLCLTTGAVGVMGFGITVLFAGSFDHRHLQAIAQPLPTAALYAVLCACIGGVLVWAARRVSVASASLAVVALSIFQVLLFRGVVTGAMQRSANDMTAAVAAVRRQLPPDTQLVSFGPVHHRFAYYYGTPIPRLQWPQQLTDVPPGTEFFCLESKSGNPVERGLPFEWEPVASLVTDSSARDVPEVLTIIGRILRPRDASLAPASMPATQSR